MYKYLRHLLAILGSDLGWTTEMAVTGVGAIDNAIPEQLTNAPCAVMHMKNSL